MRVFRIGEFVLPSEFAAEAHPVIVCAVDFLPGLPIVRIGGDGPVAPQVVFVEQLVKILRGADRAQAAAPVVDVDAVSDAVDASYLSGCRGIGRLVVPVEFHFEDRFPDVVFVLDEF